MTKYKSLKAFKITTKQVFFLTLENCPENDEMDFWPFLLVLFSCLANIYLIISEYTYCS